MPYEVAWLDLLRSLKFYKLCVLFLRVSHCFARAHGSKVNCHLKFHLGNSNQFEVGLGLYSLLLSPNSAQHANSSKMCY